MRGVVMKVIVIVAAAVLVAAGCSNGPEAIQGAGTAPPTSETRVSTTAPIPTTAPPTTAPTPTTAPPQTTGPAPATTAAPGTTAPPVTAPPNSTPSLTVPAVSIVGEVVNAEQQAIIDVAVRSWRLYWTGIQNPNDPNLDAELQTVFVDNALESHRAFFQQLRDAGQYVRSSDETPPVFSPIVGSIVIEGDSATMLTCEVAPGEVVAPGPDGNPVGMGRRVMVYRTTYEFRRIGGSWFVSQRAGAGDNVEGTSCVGHLEY